MSIRHASLTNNSSIHLPSIGHPRGDTLVCKGLAIRHLIRHEPLDRQLYLQKNDSLIHQTDHTALKASWNLAGVEPGNQERPGARTWDMFWYKSKWPVLFEIVVQIKTKEGHGVENPPPRSFCCGVRNDSLIHPTSHRCQMTATIIWLGHFGPERSLFGKVV